jgi:TPR repeat protein
VAKELELYKRACKLGAPEACLALGEIYDASYCGEAVTLLSPRCLTLREPQSCDLLANQYERGLGVDRDAEKAKEFALLACQGGLYGRCSEVTYEAGCVFALDTCDQRCAKGDMFSCTQSADRLSEGTREERKQARDLYDRACKKGHGVACFGLGVLQRAGDGGDREPRLAASSFAEACGREVPEGCNNLGMMLLSGEGVAPSVRQAADAFERACDLLEIGTYGVLYGLPTTGSLEGCLDLGSLLAEGGQMPQNLSRAAELFKKACDGGSSPACTRLGQSYLSGTGVTKDPALAAAAYRKACEGSDAGGCYGLAYQYEEGLGVAADLPHAAELYRKACDGEEFRGCVNLGSLYLQGKGVAKSLERATVLYARACDGGSGEGCHNAGNSYHDGVGVAKDVAQAARLFQKACDKGQAEGCQQSRKRLSRR